MHRQSYIQNGQMFVRFTRRPNVRTILQALFYRPRGHLNPIWRAYDIYGKPMHAPHGLTICSPNTWLRRFLYAVGVPRRLTRKV